MNDCLFSLVFLSAAFLALLHHAVDDNRNEYCGYDDAHYHANFAFTLFLDRFFCHWFFCDENYFRLRLWFRLDNRLRFGRQLDLDPRFRWYILALLTNCINREETDAVDPLWALVSIDTDQWSVFFETELETVICVCSPTE